MRRCVASFTHRERLPRDRVWAHIESRQFIGWWRRQVILANAPSTPQISLPKRTLSAAWGAWQRTQRLVPYSENKGYASNPRRSLSYVTLRCVASFTHRERYTKHAKLKTLPIWPNNEPTTYGQFKQTGPENLEPYQRQGCKTWQRCAERTILPQHKYPPGVPL